MVTCGLDNFLLMPNCNFCFIIQIPRKECSVYDPKFTSQEREMLGNLGFNVIEKNEVRFMNKLPYNSFNKR